jgi:microcystin-dependent protein
MSSLKTPVLPKTAPVAPAPEGYPGEIRAFAGPIPPVGWMLCDGRELNETDYPKLYAAIGDLWGSSGKGKFNIPDLRGAFLRAWNEKRTDRWADPEAAGRLIPPGAPVDPNVMGNQVGTLQADQFLSHTHVTTLTARWGDKFADTIGWSADNGQHPHGPFDIATAPNGGAETRPKNAYVMFCLRDGK